MTAFRIAGLLCAAFLTMGSGGVAQAPDEQSGTVLEPEYVDESASSPAAPVERPADVIQSTDAAVARPIVSPETSAAVPDDGAAIEFALSDDYIQGQYFTGDGILGFDGTKGHVGAYFSDNRDIIGLIGVMTDPTPLLTDGLTLSVGGRGYVALLSDPDDDVVGLAPGVEARYELAFEHPMFLVGNVFYSPDILTLGDAEDIIDIDARFEAQVVPSIVGFIGYREFRFDSDEADDKEAASEFQVGVRFVL